MYHRIRARRRRQHRRAGGLHLMALGGDCRTHSVQYRIGMHGVVRVGSRNSTHAVHILLGTGSAIRSVGIGIGIDSRGRRILAGGDSIIVSITCSGAADNQTVGIGACIAIITIRHTDIRLLGASLRAALTA